MTADEIRQKWPATEDCSCDECVGYCERPGWFLPDEVRVAAEYLGLSLREMFERYLVVDWWGGGSDIDHHVGILAPGKPSETGRVASIGFVRGEGCVFLNEDGKCSIHAVKPHECRLAHHVVVHAGNSHLEIARVWDGEEGRALIREVGYDPDDLPVPEGTVLDLLELLL